MVYLRYSARLAASTITAGVTMACSSSAAHGDVSDERKSNKIRNGQRLTWRVWHRHISSAYALNRCIQVIKCCTRHAKLDEPQTHIRTLALTVLHHKRGNLGAYAALNPALLDRHNAVRLAHSRHQRRHIQRAQTSKIDHLS